MCAEFYHYCVHLTNVNSVFSPFLLSLVQFLCLKNIRTFLKVCHDKFGLRNSELFDPFDLFDVRDFGKVSRLTSDPPLPSPPTRSAVRVVCCSVVMRCCDTVCLMVTHPAE